MLEIIISILACVPTAFLGRMGGSGRWPRQCRVVGIPLILTGLAYLHGVHSWWALIIFAGLSIGAISTYHDYIGHDNFFLHGACLGLASLPLTIITGHWLLLLIRVIACAVWMGVWSLIWTSDVVEESGRYAPLPLSILLV